MPIPRSGPSYRGILAGSAQDLITAIMERIAWRAARKAERGVVLRKALLQKTNV
jgi:hypothetical protein